MKCTKSYKPLVLFFLFQRGLQVLLLLSIIVTVVSAWPAYQTISLDDLDRISVNDVGTRRFRIVRVPRQSPRVERQTYGHHDHVDYGAHTGHHGAFGWYADFPVFTNH